MTKQRYLNNIQAVTQTLYKQKRDYYLNHFYEFNKDVLKWPDIYEPLHRKVCNFITDNVNKKKLLLLLPRGTFKSSIVTVGYSLYRIANNPSERILIANATRPMATQFLSQIKNHLQRNEEFKKLFGDLSQTADSWREDRIYVAREKSYEQKEPTVWAQGIESNVVGSHFDIAILDDVVARENITTKEQIEKVKNFYKDALDLIDADKGHKKVIVIGTTWHWDDLYQWIQDDLMGDFEMMRLPAYKDEWETGELLFPTRLSWKVLKELKKQQGNAHFCTPAESPVIMGDLSVKPISEIKEGDEVCGWDEGKGKQASLKRVKVKKTFQYKRNVVEMKMKSGRIVRCTPDHKWFTGRGFSDKAHKRYKPAKVVSRLMYIFDPTTEKLTPHGEQVAHWLGGFFDADGSCGSGYNSIALHQSRFANPLVYRKIKEVLETLNFDYSYWEKIYNEKNPRSRFGFKGMYWINGGKQSKMDFLNWCKPFKKERILQTVYGKTNFIQEKDKIIHIKPIGRKKVYALETETGNYIVWGYGSSNSAQYMLNPIPTEDQIFRPPFKTFEETDLRGIDLKKFVSVDPAISEEKSADYSAMVCVGVDRNNDWYILDVWHDRVKPKRLIDQIFYWNEKWKPVSVGLETVSFQRALQYFMYDEMKKRNLTVPLKELGNTNRTKGDRIRGLQPRYEMGSIFHPQKTAIPMVDSLEDELLRFPKGKNDDLIDALASCLELAFPPKQREERVSIKRSIYPA